MGKKTIDITIGCNTQTVTFVCSSVSPTPPTPPTPTTYDYYIGWTTGTKASFAALDDSGIKSIAQKKTASSYSGQFGQNKIFFLLYKADELPRKIVFTSAGQSMEQDIVNDNTCPHADVEIDSETYKVFGMWFYRPNTDDTMTITY